jgi:dihydroflavonol-4-reductase
VVVNPASVQGVGRASGTGRLLLDLARGRLPLAVATRLSIVDLLDCAEAHLAAARIGRPGARYVLSGFSLGLEEVFAIMARHLGSTAPRPPWLLPANTLALPARLSRWLAPGRWSLCPETVANLRHGAVYDGSLATRELGLRYRTAEATLVALADWFRAEGWL